MSINPSNQPCPVLFIPFRVLVGLRILSSLFSFNLPVVLRRISAYPGAGLQGNPLCCLSHGQVSALTIALIVLSQKPQELFSKSCRKTPCFSPKVAQCLFTKDVQSEFWKVTKLVPDYTVRAKTCQRAPSILMSHFQLLPGLMLGRAGPVCCSSAVLLVTLGKSFAFSVPVFPLATSLCYCLAGTNLLSADTLLSRTGALARTTVLFCFSLLMNFPAI